MTVGLLAPLLPMGPDLTDTASTRFPKSVAHSSTQLVQVQCPVSEFCEATPDLLLTC